MGFLKEETLPIWFFSTQTCQCFFCSPLSAKDNFFKYFIEFNPYRFRPFSKRKSFVKLSNCPSALRFTSK